MKAIQSASSVSRIKATFLAAQLRCQLPRASAFFLNMPFLAVVYVGV